MRVLAVPLQCGEPQQNQKLLGIKFYSIYLLGRSSSLRKGDIKKAQFVACISLNNKRVSEWARVCDSYNRIKVEYNKDYGHVSAHGGWL